MGERFCIRTTVHSRVCRASKIKILKCFISQFCFCALVTAVVARARTASIEAHLVCIDIRAQLMFFGWKKIALNRVRIVRFLLQRIGTADVRQWGS